MAYSVAWDESDPAGSVPANTIDTEIQETKIAIRERIEQVIPDWSDDLVDPKTIFKDQAMVSLSAPAPGVVPHNSNYLVPWETEDIDKNSMVDIATNPERITIQTAGIYIVAARIRLFSDSGTGAYLQALTIRKNGTTSIATAAAYSNITDEAGVQVTTLADLVATDFLEVLAFQNSGTTASFSNPSTGNQFWTTRVG